MSNDRLARFRAHLASLDLAGAIIRRPANVQYLTGFPGTVDRPSFAVIGSGKVVIVAPGSTEGFQRAATSATGAVGYRAPGGTVDRVADVDALSAEALVAAIDEAGLSGQRIAIESGDVTAHHAAVIDRAATAVPLDEFIAGMRRTKDADEVALIREAVRCNDVGFAAAASVVEAGKSEFSIHNKMVDAMQKAANAPIDMTGPNCAFISGPRTMLLAAGATSRRLEPGDLLIVDINPVIRSYKGDTTRTFSVGNPTSEQQRVHDALVRGLEAAEKSVKPGVRASAVANALQAPIIAAGCGALIVHGGHGIGLEHLERPYIIPGDDMLLEEGMVIAIEPGVYLPGVGGLRIEDNFLVTATGVEVLSHYPRQLTVCW